jgi:hypothetical protein
MGFIGHPYREKIPLPPEEPVPDDWHDQLRGEGAWRALCMALGTLVCALGFPSLVQLAFDPTGPGAHLMSVEFFIGGGVAVTVFFVIVAAIS